MSGAESPPQNPPSRAATPPSKRQKTQQSMQVAPQTSSSSISSLVSNNSIPAPVPAVKITTPQKIQPSIAGNSIPVKVRKFL